MILKKASEIDIMAEAAVINREALETVAKAIVPGVTTKELDLIAEEYLRQNDAIPAFLGYGEPPFPSTLCISRNDVVVHGIPDETKLQEGDIVSVDIGCFYKGYAADLAYTFAVGNVSDAAKSLLRETERSLYAGIAKATVGNRLGCVSSAIQHLAEDAGFWVIREFVGHGIGTDFHELPEVPNYGSAGRGHLLRAGLVLAIEPMVTETRTSVVIDSEDEWTAPTANGCLAAHFEHTVAITEAGPRILTAKDSSPISEPEKLLETYTSYTLAGGAYGS